MEMIGDSETDSNGGPAGPLRRQQCIELAVFLFLIVPSMAFSFLIIRQARPLGFALLSVAVIFRDLGLMGLVLFLVWRNGEPFSALGLSLENLGGEMGLGFLLFFPMTFAAATIENSLQNAGLSAPSVPMPALVSEKGLPEFVLAFFLVAVVALAEETIFRGYLIMRFRAVTSSTSAAIVFSTAIFSLGHGYEGMAGIATVGFLGIVLALVYLWRKSLTAVIVMHFLQDFGGIVLMPLLKQFRVFH
jgi:CAAX protease family protein